MWPSVNLCDEQGNMTVSKRNVLLTPSDVKKESRADDAEVWFGLCLFQFMSRESIFVIWRFIYSYL